MNGALRYEIRLALASLVTGIGLMIVYDLVCVFRLICPHGRIVTDLEDISYGIYCAVITFGLLYEQNDGILRGYVIAGVLAGMVLYQRLAGSILLRYLKKGQEYFKIQLIRRKKRKRVER